jgi:cardiolipin hydrolase
MTPEVLFTRDGSVAERIERLIRGAGLSFDAALYRFSQERLALALGEAQEREVRIRLVLDRGKFEESRRSQQLVRRLPLRLARGRDRGGSKMHHKFALLDDQVVLTGSYNWTQESEEQNYENLLILRQPEVVQVYRPEFEALWAEAEEP